MGDTDKPVSYERIEDGVDSKPQEYRKKLEQNSTGPWYFASNFLLFWALLFLAVVVPLLYRLPVANTIEDASKGGFIAERAYDNLYEFDKIGPKVTGSDANENKTVQFLLKELALIQQSVLDDYFDMEIDVQVTSGSYLKSEIIYMYRAVQNVIVKLSPKNSTSDTYLLVNSHFDSKPTSPSAGDAGHMVVTILEVLRVMSTTKQTFEHPIVFLINGAEEKSLLAAHGFISHKWATFCKVVLNLDAAGSGGREILFQTGPNHPWLVDSYKKNAKHPFATTMAEEIFQTGLLPSDTDFRIFTQYADLIGLDLGQCFNGYVYHTRYDRIDVIPRTSLQNTGDNVLGLVRGLSNATELRNLNAYSEGHAVFFDVLGLYFVSYSESNGIIFNYAVAGATIVLIFVSLWRTASASNVFTGHVVGWFILILVLQVIALLLGLGLPVVVAYLFDKYGLSLTYYSTPALLIGLYVCPSLIGLSLPSFIYLKLQRDDKVSFAKQLQLVLHGHATILALLGFGLTLYGLRTAYVVTWTLVFYIIPLAINLLTTLHDRGFAWTGVLKAFQVIPFLYNSYLFYTFVVVLTPMMGRFGLSTNPDLIVSALTALGTIFSLGFLVLLVHISRRSSLIFLGLLAVTALTVYTASSTQIGFPYRPKTNVERVHYLQARRVFYEYDGTVSKDESGYVFDFQDRRGAAPLMGTKVNLTGLVSMKSDCEKYMMCGVPLNYKSTESSRVNGMWLPREQPIETPSVPVLELLSKTVLADNKTVRFEFNLTSPDQTSLLIQPYEDVTVSNWSFLLSLLESKTSSSSPFCINISYGIDSSPLNFFIELTKPNGDFKVPLFKIGVSSLFIHSKGDALSLKLAASFPSFAVAIQFPAMYQRYIY
ncbi:endoplasmic reticulum metallopeptidase 1-like isoform X2 [Drosophila obscura]|uniref:endoplasmic reticulum metallopeptidase 1-like isoform X2 n=1 Tax=Drosophila obscura TaxID=7282 RepID=UPI001BB2942E|nr:endoplasmic reticulum metallopeptidase 1-like isoform X2 [Drosophila obscura]